MTFIINEIAKCAFHFLNIQRIEISILDVDRHNLGKLVIKTLGEPHH